MGLRLHSIDPANHHEVAGLDVESELNFADRETAQLVGSQGEDLLQRELATVGPMPRLETMKNSNVFSWGEAYFELCSERPLGLMPSISKFP